MKFDPRNTNMATLLQQTWHWKQECYKDGLSIMSECQVPPGAGREWNVLGWSEPSFLPQPLDISYLPPPHIYSALTSLNISKLTYLTLLNNLITELDVRDNTVKRSSEIKYFEEEDRKYQSSLSVAQNIASKLDMWISFILLGWMVSLEWK